MNCEKETRDGFLPPPASWREQTENRPLSPADYSCLLLEKKETENRPFSPV